MSVHRLIPMCLLILCAATTGCGTSVNPKADSERLAAAGNVAPPRKSDEEEAAEKKAAQDKVAEKKAAEGEAAEKEAAKEKADDGYVKVKVEVELRGVLSCTKEAATIDKQPKWVLDFGEDKEMRAKAKSLDGKTVLVKGSAILRGARLGR